MNRGKGLTHWKKTFVCDERFLMFQTGNLSRMMNLAFFLWIPFSARTKTLIHTLPPVLGMGYCPRLIPHSVNPLIKSFYFRRCLSPSRRKYTLIINLMHSWSAVIQSRRTKRDNKKHQLHRKLGMPIPWWCMPVLIRKMGMPVVNKRDFSWRRWSRITHIFRGSLNLDVVIGRRERIRARSM